MIRSLSFFLVIWVFALLPVHAQTGFNGTFVADVDGMPCRFTTKTSYNVINGTYDEGGISLRVMGTFYGKKASGDLKDPSSDAVVATFQAIIIDSNLIDLTFSVGEQKRSHTFLREGKSSPIVATSSNIAPGAHDPLLVGNWSHQIITSSGNSSFQTVYYFYIYANGQYAQYSKAVGGGADWSYNSGKSELKQRGLWYSKDLIIYLKAEGQDSYIAAANYDIYKGRLVTKDVGGQKIWDKM